MLGLWQNRGMFWVTEQRLVDQANTILRNNWMTQLELEELERKITENDSSIDEEDRKVEVVVNNTADDLRNILTVSESEEEPVSLQEEEITIIEEIAEVLESGKKDRLPALRDVSKKKLLEETAKVDKVLCKFKTQSIAKTNELCYAGAVFVTTRLGVKISKTTNRKEPMWKRRL